MDQDEQDDVILLDRPVVYVDEPEEVTDEGVGFEDVTAEYVLGQVEDDYDEVVEIDPIDDGLYASGEIVLLETMRVDPADLEVA